MFLMKHTTPSGYSAGNILLYSLSVAPHLLCPRLLQVPSILLYLGEISLDSSVLSRIDNNLSLTMHVVNPFFLHRSPLLKQIIICHVLIVIHVTPDINFLASHWADSNFFLPLPNMIIDNYLPPIPTSSTQLPVRGFFFTSASGPELLNPLERFPEKIILEKSNPDLQLTFVLWSFLSYPMLRR